MAAVLAASSALAYPSGAAVAAPSQSPPPATTGCALSSPTAPAHYVIDITFDNVHFTRDNPNVPSDVEQIPTC